MKPQYLIIMTVSASTPSQCIALIMMVVGHESIERIFLEHLHKKETGKPSIKDSRSTIKEVAHLVDAADAAEAHT
jgi:hypothetical protein